MKKMKNNNIKKPMLLLVFVVVAFLCIWFFFTRDNKGVNSKPDNSLDSSETINFGPPTEEEQKSGDAKKDDIVNKEQSVGSRPPGEAASVIITDAGQYSDVIEVRAFISNHYEDGTCTIVFTQASEKISKTTPAYRDVSTTICTNPLFKRSEFPSSGDWQLIVSYQAENGSGQSEPQKVTID